MFVLLYTTAIRVYTFPMYGTIQTIGLHCITFITYNKKNISDSTLLYPYDTNRYIAYVSRYMSLCFNVYSS